MKPQVVQRQRHSTGETRRKLGVVVQTGYRQIAESLRTDDVEVARGLIHQQQHHAIDDERLSNARDKTFAEAIEVEVAVEIARESHERAAVVVLVAVERPVERILNRALDRAEQQHDHDRRQHRDDHVVAIGRVEKHDARQPQQRRVDREDRENDRRVHEAALDDHLDVHQPIADERRRERERHEAERDHRQLHRQCRPQTERVRQCVAERERTGAESGSPDDPPQLPARRRGPDAVHRPGQDDQPGDHVHREIQRFELIQQVSTRE